MKLSHPSRRSFLSSLAILSAGTALGSVRNFFNETEFSLEQQWKQFCFNAEADWYPYITPGANQLYKPCKGHFYKTGDAVLLGNSGMVAIPTWISWTKEKNKADDMIISFVEHETNQKIGTINRFELTALISATASKGDSITLIQDITTKKYGIKKGNPVKTLVKKDRYSQIEMNFTGNKKTIQKKLIYNA